MFVIMQFLCEKLANQGLTNAFQPVILRAMLFIYHIFSRLTPREAITERCLKRHTKDERKASVRRGNSPRLGAFLF